MRKIIELLKKLFKKKVRIETNPLKIARPRIWHPKLNNE